MFRPSGPPRLTELRPPLPESESESFSECLLEKRPIGLKRPELLLGWLDWLDWLECVLRCGVPSGESDTPFLRSSASRSCGMRCCAPRMLSVADERPDVDEESLSWRAFIELLPLPEPLAYLESADSMVKGCDFLGSLSPACENSTKYLSEPCLTLGVCAWMVELDALVPSTPEAILCDCFLPSLPMLTSEMSIFFQALEPDVSGFHCTTSGAPARVDAGVMGWKP